MRKLLFLIFLFAVPAGVQAQGAELVQLLSRTLGVTPEQASAGAGALFELAKKTLKPEDFAKIAKVVPGMDGMLKSAPSAGGGLASSLGSMVGGSVGGMGVVTDQFKALGLSPEMVGKFMPVIGKYVESKGGAAVASLLAGAWK
ncbi:MAG TPA: DUF2780 domain-containing protein [Burkholderiales bacterium]